jgi:hypothetical protein
MMDRIKVYKKQIVLIAFALGAVGYFNILPDSLPVVNEMAKMVYAGLVLFGGYVFWTFYADAPSLPVKIPRRVPPRQRPKQKRPLVKELKPNVESEFEEKRVPSDRIFEEFHKD